MSLDRSLKSADSLQRHRNVLSRAERVEKLKAQDRWDEEKSVFGLPKVANRKASVGTKAKAKTAAQKPGEAGTAAQPSAS
jgi:small basic protein (TIGR04137 family)